MANPRAVLVRGIAYGAIGLVAGWFGFRTGLQIAGLWLGVVMAINAAIFAVLIASVVIGRERRR